jgi:L-alanine-DL-glutamate epimerase-like enolase superfamily enzyme
MQIAPLMVEVQKKLHIFGRNSPLTFGISAVDVALWDIAGKAADAPVYRLLGGGPADLACYASLVRYSDPRLVRASVRRAIDTGFQSLKLHEIELSASCRPRRGRPRRRARRRRELCLDIERSSKKGGGTRGIPLEMAGGADLATRKL